MADPDKKTVHVLVVGAGELSLEAKIRLGILSIDIGEQELLVFLLRKV
jgi:hypothetical protein